jgi:DNA-binding transcriptional regulator YiaG
LSQADFGRLIRATGQAVIQWETGVNKIPGPVELRLLLQRPDALDGLE